MKPLRPTIARRRQAARRRLSRFTNAGPVQAIAEVSEARDARFADAALSGLRPPREPHFVPPPNGVPDLVLAVPPVLSAEALDRP